MSCFKTVVLALTVSFFLLGYVLADEADDGESSVGNGGRGRVCLNKQTGEKSIELFDYWYARILDNFYQVDLGPGNYQEKVYYVLERLEKFDPLRAERLRYKADELLANLEHYMTDHPLTKPNDDDAIHTADFGNNEVLFGESDIVCEEVTLALRVKKIRGHVPRFKFIKAGWNFKEGEDQEIVRAGILLHEIVGEDFISRDQDYNRGNTRHFNAEIGSLAFNHYTAEDYLTLLKDSEKISRFSPLFINGKQYMTKGTRTDLQLQGDNILDGEEIPDYYARFLNLDFEMVTEEPKLNRDQTLQVGEILLDLPQGTVIESEPSYAVVSETLLKEKKPFAIRNTDLIIVTSSTNSIVLHARGRTIENISKISLGSSRILYVQGITGWNRDKFPSLTPIEIHGQKIEPYYETYGFHLNGALAEMTLSTDYPFERQGEEYKTYSFKTANNETIDIRALRNNKYLYFNEEELLKYYETGDVRDYSRQRLATPSDVRKMDPDFTDRGIKVEIGETQIHLQNGKNGTTKNLLSVNLDILTKDNRQMKFRLAGWRYDVGESSESQRMDLDIGDVVGYSQNSGTQWGLNWKALHWELDKLRGFELLDISPIGPAVRFYPLPGEHLRVDLAANTTIRSRAYAYGEESSRVSSEWLQHAQQVSGATFDGKRLGEKRLDEIVIEGRDLRAYQLDLNLCYKSPDGSWMCQLGGSYRWEDFYSLNGKHGGDHDRLSPYQDSFDKYLKSWNAYVDMKYYFDQMDDPATDADNFFFLRAEIDDSPLGSNIQKLYGGPGSSNKIMEKRTAVTAGLGLEW